MVYSEWSKICLRGYKSGRKRVLNEVNKMKDNASSSPSKSLLISFYYYNVTIFHKSQRKPCQRPICRPSYPFSRDIKYTPMTRAMELFCFFIKIYNAAQMCTVCRKGIPVMITFYQVYSFFKIDLPQTLIGMKTDP